MNNNIFYPCLIVLFLLLVGCSNDEQSSIEQVEKLKESNNTSELLTNNEEIKENTGIIGRVKEREGDKILVIDLENEERATWLSNAAEEIEVGQKIKVWYEGVVLFSNPAQAEIGNYEIITENQQLFKLMN